MELPFVSNGLIRPTSPAVDIPGRASPPSLQPYFENLEECLDRDARIMALTIKVSKLERVVESLREQFNHAFKNKCVQGRLMRRNSW